jgi:hypothetical protein
MSKTPSLDHVKSYFDNVSGSMAPSGSDWNSKPRKTSVLTVAQVVESQPFLWITVAGTEPWWIIWSPRVLGGLLRLRYLEAPLKLPVRHGKTARLFSDKSQLPVCDYTVASGIFNFEESILMID